MRRPRRSSTTGVRRLAADGWTVRAVVEQDAVGRMATVRLDAPADVETAAVVDLLFASSGIEPEVSQGADALEVLPSVTLPVAEVGALIVLKLLARAPTRPRTTPISPCYSTSLARTISRQRVASHAWSLTAATTGARTWSPRSSSTDADRAVDVGVGGATASDGATTRRRPGGRPQGTRRPPARRRPSLPDPRPRHARPARRRRRRTGARAGCACRPSRAIVRRARRR